MLFFSDFLTPEEEKIAEEAMNRLAKLKKECKFCNKNVDEPCDEEESKTCSNMMTDD